MTKYKPEIIHQLITHSSIISLTAILFLFSGALALPGYELFLKHRHHHPDFPNSLLLLALLFLALILLSIPLYKVIRVKRKFTGMGVEIRFQQAINMWLQGGFDKEVAAAASKAAAYGLDIPLDRLQIHAASGGNPLRLVESIEYARNSPVPSARAGMKHLSLIDLSGKDPLEVICEAEKENTLEVEGEFEFSGRKFSYSYKAQYFRPVVSLAFDGFSEAEVIREVRRNIQDVQRYHKELIRVDVEKEEQIKQHITGNVLRPAWWERNFRLVLVRHHLEISRRNE